MTQEECGNCAYFAPDQEHCRRYPPTTHIDSSERISQVLTLWPTVRREDWCGEYRAGDFASQQRMKGIDEGSQAEGMS
jgi:hypothetical protein